MLFADGKVCYCVNFIKFGGMEGATQTKCVLFTCFTNFTFQLIALKKKKKKNYYRNFVRVSIFCENEFFLFFVLSSKENTKY